MNALILTAITISLASIGIYAATWRGMIFHKPAKYVKGLIPKLICKPLFCCPICMSSVWTLVYFAVFGFPDLLIIPVVILMTAGLNTIIVSMIANIIPDEEE